MANKEARIDIRLDSELKASLKKRYGNNLSKHLRARLENELEREKLKQGCICFDCRKTLDFDQFTLAFINDDESERINLFLICDECKNCYETLPKAKERGIKNLNNETAGSLLHFALLNGIDALNKAKLEMNREEYNLESFKMFKKYPKVYSVGFGMVIHDKKKANEEGI